MNLQALALPVATGLVLIMPTIAQAKPIAFVGCPVLRDVALPALPCWLARDGDKLYYLGSQTDTIPPVPFYSPQLLHKVLVEAETVDGPLVCGGLPTKNARASVLAEISPECDEILPQGDIVPPPAVKPSAPYRKGMRLAVGAPPAPPGMGLRAPPPPSPPFTTKTFSMDFMFNEDFVYLDDSFQIAQAVWYLEGTKGRALTVTVPRNQVKLTNGVVMDEDHAIVERRAERLRGILQDWRVPADKVRVVMPRQPKPNDRILTLTVDP